MRLNKFLRIVIPFFAGISIIGTGYSIFNFAELNTSSTFDGEDAPTVQIVEKATGGTLSVQAETYYEEDNIYEDYTQGLYLIILQTRSYFNFTHFRLTYTPDQDSNWEEGVKVPIHFSAQVEFGGSSADYFNCSWSSKENGVYDYDIDDQLTIATTKDESAVCHIPVPSVFFAEGKEPIVSTDVLGIINDLKNNNSKLTFTFTATMDGNAG